MARRRDEDLLLHRGQEACSDRDHKGQDHGRSVAPTGACVVDGVGDADDLIVFWQSPRCWTMHTRRPTAVGLQDDNAYSVFSLNQIFYLPAISHPVVGSGLRGVGSDVVIGISMREDSVKGPAYRAISITRSGTHATGVGPDAGGGRIVR